MTAANADASARDTGETPNVTCTSGPLVRIGGDMGMNATTESKVSLAGWLLFVMSALGFIVSSLRSGDAVALLASVFFLAGCIVFLIPCVMRLRRSGPR